MINSPHAHSVFAVTDIEAARAFYGDVLGFDVKEAEEGFLTISLMSGGQIFVYGKPDHEPAVFTILNLPVADVEAAVDELAGKGVETVRYDGFDHDDRGIVRDMGPAIAWFTDPSGNIIAVFDD